MWMSVSPWHMVHAEEMQRLRDRMKVMEAEAAHDGFSALTSESAAAAAAAAAAATARTSISEREGRAELPEPAAHGSNGSEARPADPWAFLGGGRGGGATAEGSAERQDEDGRRGLEETGDSYHSVGGVGAAEDSDYRGGKEVGSCQILLAASSSSNAC